MINKYLNGKAQLLYPEPKDVFPCDLIHNEGCAVFAEEESEEK